MFFSYVCFFCKLVYKFRYRHLCSTFLTIATSRHKLPWHVFSTQSMALFLAKIKVYFDNKINEEWGWACPDDKKSGIITGEQCYLLNVLRVLVQWERFKGYNDAHSPIDFQMISLIMLYQRLSSHGSVSSMNSKAPFLQAGISAKLIISSLMNESCRAVFYHLVHDKFS